MIRLFDPQQADRKSVLPEILKLKSCAEAFALTREWQA